MNGVKIVSQKSKKKLTLIKLYTNYKFSYNSALESWLFKNLNNRKVIQKCTGNNIYKTLDCRHQDVCLNQYHLQKNIVVTSIYEHIRLDCTRTLLDHRYLLA